VFPSLPHPLHRLLLHRIRVSPLPKAFLLVELRVTCHPQTSVVGFRGVEVSGGGYRDGEARGVRYMFGGGGRGIGGEDYCVVQAHVPRGLH